MSSRLAVELIKTQDGFWTWKGNEDGYAAHTNCIIAVHEGHSIGDPERWLVNHDLHSFPRQRAIRMLDICKGTASDVAIVESLAKKLKMIVIKGKRD